MMKIIRMIFIAGLLISFNSCLTSQTSIRLHNFNLLYKSELRSRLTLKADHSINDRWDLSTYFYAGSNWGEGLAGFSYHVNNNLTAGLMIGLQNDVEHIFRILPHFYYRKNNFSVMGLFGHGPLSNNDRFALQIFHHWDKMQIGIEGIKEFSIYAVGPRFHFLVIDKYKLYLWGAPYYDFSYDNYAAMFGIYATFRSDK